MQKNNNNAMTQIYIFVFVIGSIQTHKVIISFKYVDANKIKKWTFQQNIYQI